ncbi:hypothetical protein ABLE93_05160 [Xanthobacter sp. KR7-65]|uniref:hypothetical protein n=1 Tax=Xanthobacter sp. KR7-65 TaxID=3156612 RepID=UPI0032B380A4
MSTIALRMLAFLILVMLAMTVTVAQQRGAGAYVADLSATDAGEARHFVTGLMVADLVASGLSAPAAFASDYALRLPVALPLSQVTLFHGIEAAWLGVLPPTTAAALLLPALSTALLLVAAGWAAARATGPLPGVAAGFMLSAVHPVREASLSVGPDLPLALALLLTALALSGLGRTGRVRDAALLAAAGSLAVLLAPAGALVIAVPPLAALLSGRLGVMRRAGFWGPLILWVGLAIVMASVSGARPEPFASAALVATFAGLRDAFGLLPVGLAGAGFLFTLGAGRQQAEGEEEEVDSSAMVPVAALAAALGLAVALGLPAGTGVLLLAAPVAMLAAFGAMRVIGLLLSGWTIVSGLAVALLLLASAMPALLEPIHKGAIGMDAAAEAFLALPSTAGSGPAVIVVAADAGGVGAFAAAVAQRDPVGRIFVVDAARLPTEAPDGFLKRLQEIGASALVLAPGEAGTARAAAGGLGRIGRFPRADGGGAVELFAVAFAPAAEAPPDPRIILRRLATPGS